LVLSLLGITTIALARVYANFYKAEVQREISHA